MQKFPLFVDATVVRLAASCLKRLGTSKTIKRSMIRIAPRLGGDINYAALRLAVLWFEPTCLHLHFFDE